MCGTAQPKDATNILLSRRRNLQVVPLRSIVPNMGTQQKTACRLGDALFSKTQQKVLGLLYGNPDRCYFAKEIVRFAGVGTGGVYRELDKLTAVGLLKVKRIGNQKQYQANQESMIFDDLANLLRKVTGISDANSVR